MCTVYTGRCACECISICVYPHMDVHACECKYVCVCMCV
uniref:Uncharacterized protein n=1 Tax=Anguilla anguilla TaxID=7936 RepID=A0A0E9WIX5_ANGAN